jgi:hypothetical protein
VAVVTLSLVSLGPWSIPVTAIRSLRAFRVARLFRRVKSLRNIITAITLAAVPVLNSFFIMFIAASTCA